MMRDARKRTLELVDGLDAEQLIGPKLPTVNPLQWEIGHVAWFHEFFILRQLYGAPQILANGDSIYDSIAIVHVERGPELLRECGQLEGADPKSALNSRERGGAGAQ